MRMCVYAKKRLINKHKRRAKAQKPKRAKRPGIGCFGELSVGPGGVCTPFARDRAVSYVGRYDGQFPNEALGIGMPRSRIRRV